MGAQFFTPGTKRIRDVLHDAFSPLNVASNAASFSSLFDPTNSVTLAQIASSSYMDLPPSGDPNWPSLHRRFQGFLTALHSADPTVHLNIKQAMYGALTSNPAMPMKFYVAHQNSGYKFVSWAEEDDSGIGWLNCLLFCPQMGGAIAKRLRRVIRRNPVRKKSEGARRSKRAK